MTKSSRDVFTCSICKKEYQTENDGDKCTMSHDIVYVGLERRLWKKFQLVLEQAYLLGVDLDTEIYQGLKNIKEEVRR